MIARRPRRTTPHLIVFGRRPRCSLGDRTTAPPSEPRTHRIRASPPRSAPDRDPTPPPVPLSSSPPLHPPSPCWPSPSARPRSQRGQKPRTTRVPAAPRDSRQTTRTPSGSRDPRNSLHRSEGWSGSGCGSRRLSRGRCASGTAPPSGWASSSPPRSGGRDRNHGGPRACRGRCFCFTSGPFDRAIRHLRQEYADTSPRSDRIDVWEGRAFPPARSVLALGKGGPCPG